MKKLVDVEIKVNGLMISMIDYFVILVENECKFELLKDVIIVENLDSCIIFCCM